VGFFRCADVPDLARAKEPDKREADILSNGWVRLQKLAGRARDVLPVWPERPSMTHTGPSNVIPP